MTLEELALICQEAARELVARGERPVPAAVVLPLPDATKVLVLDGFPDDDRDRHAAMSRLAAEEMVPRSAPCFGFVAEATLEDGDGDGEASGPGGGVDVVVVAFGARGRGTHATAAPLDADGVGSWTPAEPLDPTALPFLAPLQHAADLAAADARPARPPLP